MLQGYRPKCVTDIRINRKHCHLRSMDEEIKEEVKGRLRNPLYASFVIAFVAANWKAILMLFYPEEKWLIRERVDWIAANLYDEGSELNWLFLWPVLIAVFAVSVLPWIINGLDYIAYWALVIRMKWRHQLDTKLPAHLQKVQELSIETEKLRTDNERLTRALDKATESLDLAKETIRKASENQQQTIQKMVDFDKSFRVLLDALHGQKEVKMESSPHLEFLVGLGLVDRHRNGVWSLTDAGSTIAKNITV